ncbi:MAG TPA: hypothetical protein VMV31_10360 [Terriglobales bacterium]|nr:hypothetical protein [Terriglobales bacterium]
MSDDFKCGAAPEGHLLLAALATVALLVALLIYAGARVRVPAPQPPLLVGSALPPPKEYSWSSHPETLVLGLRVDCPFCKASLPFYRQLEAREAAGTLGAHVLAVFPDDEAAVRRYLAREKLGLDARASEGPSLRIAATPTLLLVGASGILHYDWIGELNADGQSEVLHELAMPRRLFEGDTVRRSVTMGIGGIAGTGGNSKQWH